MSTADTAATLVDIRIVSASQDLFEMATMPQWSEIWELMNDFASGKLQMNWGRAEPIAVLGEVYLMLAQIDCVRRAAIAKATKE